LERCGSTEHWKKVSRRERKGPVKSVSKTKQQPGEKGRHHDADQGRTQKESRQKQAKNTPLASGRNPTQIKNQPSTLGEKEGKEWREKVKQKKRREKQKKNS